MSTEKSGKGEAAAQGLKQSAKQDERKTESRKGSDLAKGAGRVQERAQSSDGKGAGQKQK